MDSATPTLPFCRGISAPPMLRTVTEGGPSNSAQLEFADHSPSRRCQGCTKGLHACTTVSTAVSKVVTDLPLSLRSSRQPGRKSFHCQQLDYPGCPCNLQPADLFTCTNCLPQHYESTATFASSFHFYSLLEKRALS